MLQGTGSIFHLSLWTQSLPQSLVRTEQVSDGTLWKEELWAGFQKVSAGTVAVTAGRDPEGGGLP